MPYSADSFTALEVPTLAKMNKLWANDASMNDGTGIGTSVLNFRQMANGFIVQEVMNSFSTVLTGTTLIPYDNTIPQNTEGDQYMSYSFTPKASTHILEIEVVLSAYTSGTLGNGAMALFQDSVASAIASTSMAMAAGGYSIGGPYVLKHKMTAGTTSPITFKVRAGMQVGGTMTVNGIGGGAFFGGTWYSHMTIREIKA